MIYLLLSVFFYVYRFIEFIEYNFFWHFKNTFAFMHLADTFI